MRWQELINDGYARALHMVERALDGLTREDLSQQPHPDANSIGWLVWHLARVHDHHMSNLTGQEQIWITDRWYAKFNRPCDAEDTGFGHTPDNVRALDVPDVGFVLDYYRSVLGRSRGYIDMLSEQDLDRELNEPQFQPLPKVGMRLISIMSDNLQHAGQVAYLRGLLKGKGWFPY